MGNRHGNTSSSIKKERTRGIDKPRWAVWHKLAAALVAGLVTWAGNAAKDYATERFHAAQSRMERKDAARHETFEDSVRQSLEVLALSIKQMQRLDFVGPQQVQLQHLSPQELRTALQQ